MSKENQNKQQNTIKTSIAPQPAKPTINKTKTEKPVNHKTKTNSTSSGFDINMIDKTDDSDFIKF